MTDEELELLQRLADEVAVGQRDRRVEADGEQALDLAVVDRLDQRHGGQALVREVDSSGTPQTPAMYSRCSGFSMSRAPGQLVALLALLARALAVALAGDHRVAAAFAADAAGGEHQVDGGHAVLDALGVVLDAARVQQEAGLGAGPTSRRRARSSTRGTPAIFAAYSGVYFSTSPRPRPKPVVCCAMKSRSIQPRSIITCSMPLKTPMSPPERTGMKRSAVRAIGVMRGSRTISLRAVLARLPEVVGGDRRALGDVRAGDQDHLRPSGCRSTGWRCDRCRRPSSTPRRPTPCRAGRCSRCWRSAARRARTCPSGTPSRW